MKGLSLRALLPLLLWPVAEIALFVMAGDLLGFWLTLLWLAAAVVIGMALIRSVARRPTPSAESVLRTFAGILLILPGFLSDAVALLLLLPPVRALIGAWVMSRVAKGQAKVFRFNAGGAQGGPGGFGGFGAQRPASAADDIIDAEATEIRPEVRPLPGQPGRSGWTRPD